MHCILEKQKNDKNYTNRHAVSKIYIYQSELDAENIKIDMPYQDDKCTSFSNIYGIRMKIGRFRINMFSPYVFFIETYIPAKEVCPDLGIFLKLFRDKYKNHQGVFLDLDTATIIANSKELKLKTMFSDTSIDQIVGKKCDEKVKDNELFLLRISVAPPYKSFLE